MFTDVLRSLRKKHGDTQESLAAKIKVPTRTYASWERSERIMPNDVLVNIADLYDVTVDYLLGREESPKEVPWEPIKENPRPLMLDGNQPKGWSEDDLDKQLREEWTALSDEIKKSTIAFIKFQKYGTKE